MAASSADGASSVGAALPQLGTGSTPAEESGFSMLQVPLVVVICCHTCIKDRRFCRLDVKNENRNVRWSKYPHTHTAALICSCWRKEL